MSRMDGWIRLMSLFSRRALEREVDEEIEFHIESRAREYEALGMDPESARRAAERRFGDLGEVRKQAFPIENARVRRQRWKLAAEEFAQDFRFGLRGLARRPGFTVLVVLILTLGIGTNTAIFSVFRSVFLRPLPYAQPDRLVAIWEADRRSSHVPITAPNFHDWREAALTFEGMVALTTRAFVLSGGEHPERVLGGMTTVGLFDMLGVRPALGRTFLPEEEREGNDRVAIISDALWQRRFDADSAVLGRSIIADGESYAIVGVLPADFEHPNVWYYGRPFDLWTPLPLTGNRDSHQYVGIGRLGPGVSLDAAQEEMSGIAAALAERYPETNTGYGVRLLPLHEELLGNAGQLLLLLLAATGLVLLIACANIASLLMARATTRRTEIALRAALGAGRPRLFRQMLTENLPLALLGGVAGVLAAYWGMSALLSLMPAGFPRIDEVGVDAWALVFALTITVLTGLLFSLAPAFAVSTERLVEGLKEGGWGGVSAHGRARVRNALVVGQFALTLVLANAAALLVTSWVRLRATDLGFTPDPVMVAAITLRGPAYADLSVVRDYYDAVIERVEALPGVQHAGAVSKLPMHGGTNTEVTIAGRENETGRGMGPLVEVTVATPGYFRAMGIRLLAGRDLEPRDSSPADPGAVINRTFAERIWPGEDAIGKRFAVQEKTWKTVVGVVDDVRQWGLEQPAIAEAYVPYTPVPPSGMHSFGNVRYLLVRAAVDPMGLTALVRREAVAAAPGDPPVVQTYSMSDLVEGQFRGRRFSMMLLGLFAAMALVLVAAGIYGVMSYFVAQRRQEVGVRVALGASRDQVLRLVMVQAMKLAAVGVVFGLAGALASSQVIAGMLYGVSPIYLPTLTAGALCMAGVGLLGSMVPALRAVQVDPLEALRVG